MEAFLVSLAAVAVAEIGDKTQLLSLLLAARFRKPWPIVLGILAATLLNHALAALVGGWVGQALPPAALRWGVGISFLLVAAWALRPDKLDEDVTPRSHGSIFALTVAAFFVAEMGDKTQVATVLLAAKYHSLVAVVAGTTLGMMAANVPAVLFAGAALKKIPLRLVRYVAAAGFAALGVAALLGLGNYQP